MEKYLVALMFLCGLFSQVAQADDEASRWYVGAGVAELVSPGGIPMSPQEMGFLANQAYWNSSRTVENRRLANEVAVGYQMNDTFAVELGYIRGDSGAKATT